MLNQLDKLTVNLFLLHVFQQLKQIPAFPAEVCYVVIWSNDNWLVQQTMNLIKLSIYVSNQKFAFYFS